MSNHTEVTRLAETVTGVGQPIILLFLCAYASNLLGNIILPAIAVFLARSPLATAAPRIYLN